MFEETEVAKAVREMRARDPTFDMVSFLRSVRGDVQPVIQARYLPCPLLSELSEEVAVPASRVQVTGCCAGTELAQAKVCDCCTALHADMMVWGCR